MNISSSVVRVEINGVQMEIEKLEIWVGEIRGIIEVRRVKVDGNFGEMNRVGEINLSGYVNMT